MSVISTLKFVNTSSVTLNKREIVLVRLEDGTVVQAGRATDGSLNVNVKDVKSLPAGEYPTVRFADLAALTDEQVAALKGEAKGVMTCHRAEAHDGSVAGTVHSTSFRMVGKFGQPHDCRVCYGSKALRKAAPGAWQERVAGWVSQQAPVKADTAAEAAAEVAEAAAAEVEAPVVEAPKARAPRKAKAA